MHSKKNQFNWIQLGKDRIVSLLLAHGADKNLKNFMEQTALDLAKSKGNR